MAILIDSIAILNRKKHLNDEGLPVYRIPNPNLKISLTRRIIDAFGVLTGKYIAVYFYDDKTKENDS